MPNKYPEKKGWYVPKQKYTVSNWADYNESLRLRGDITVWLSDGAYDKSPVYDAILTHSPDADIVIPPSFRFNPTFANDQ